MFSESECARQQRGAFQTWYDQVRDTDDATWLHLLSAPTPWWVAPPPAAAPPPTTGALGTLRNSRASFNRTPTLGGQLIACAVQQGDVPDAVLDVINGDLATLQAVAVRAGFTYDTSMHEQAIQQMLGASSGGRRDRALSEGHALKDAATKLNGAWDQLKRVFPRYFSKRSSHRRLSSLDEAEQALAQEAEDDELIRHLFNTVQCTTSGPCKCAREVLKSPACSQLWTALDNIPLTKRAIDAIEDMLPPPKWPMSSKTYNAASISVSFGADGPAYGVGGQFQLEMGIGMDKNGRRMCFFGGAGGGTIGLQFDASFGSFTAGLNLALWEELETIPGTMSYVGMEVGFDIGVGIDLSYTMLHPYPPRDMAEKLLDSAEDLDDAVRNCDPVDAVNAIVEAAGATQPAGINFYIGISVGRCVLVIKSQS